MSRRRTKSLLPAAVLSCLLTLAGCGGDPGTTDSTSAGSSAPVSSAAEPVALVVEGPSSARCMVPNAEVLATQDIAFEGTVTDVSDATATLTVEQWYVGDTGTEQVTVSAPSQELQDLLVAVDFEEGRTYLVSAQGDRVSLCGFTAESTPELEALYEQAFAG